MHIVLIDQTHNKAENVLLQHLKVSWLISIEMYTKVQNINESKYVYLLSVGYIIAYLLNGLKLLGSRYMPYENSI